MRNGSEYDVVVFGSGAGGGTMAYALSRAGKKVLLVERGDAIPPGPESQTDTAFLGNRYRTPEFIEYPDGSRVEHAKLYVVGGQTKVYGAALLRFRKNDFEHVGYEAGVSPKWPISYEDLEPYYGQAEVLYRVHGSVDGDPTEPFHSQDYPFPPLPHEPYVERMLDRLRTNSLRPSPLPRAVDYRPSGSCHVCMKCDGYACPWHGKMDAEVACVRPALDTGNLTLWTGARCRRLVTNASGDRVVEAEVERGNERKRIRADRFVVSCGTLESARLLLRSANDAHPAGLANSSGLVGRNLMLHNVVFAWVGNRSLSIPRMHQKTFLLNDFYLGAPGFSYPLGSIQPTGQLGPDRALQQRRMLLLLMGEDLPDPDNRVTLTPEGETRIVYRTNNTKPVRELTGLTVESFRKAEFHIHVMPGPTDGELLKTSGDVHACGTIRFGTDPKTSVLDPFCKAHDVENLYVVDASFMPSSAALNPALTIIAQALRSAEHMVGGLPVRRADSQSLPR